MSGLTRSSQVANKRWKDADISVHEEQCGNNEPSNEGVCTILEQEDLGDSKTRSSGMSETFTVEEAVEAIGFGWFQWKLSMLTGVAWMADAMEMMLLSIVTPQLRCEWRLSSWKVAFITAVVFIGMMLSSSLWGNISDKYGRKVVFWALGAVFEVILAMVVMPTLGWKWLLTFSTFPLVVFAASCCWLPESARFDVLRGREDKALKTLKHVAASNGSTMPTGRLIANTQNDRGRIRDLFIPEYCKTTLLVWFIWTVLTVFIFIARACITAGWQVAYVYTPEVFPTATRAIGIGTSSGMARVGALVTPFIAQVLLKTSVYLALSVYLICCLLGTVASWALPMETTGRSLQESTQNTMDQKHMERPHGSETAESSSNASPLQHMEN
ncbi:Synaptic vesicle 2-related protein [Anabarilius grahami]|uniref:Synaptic vesicle 2-related protein n=1 Tax=Anabarilius grahami TaxID=495550 RepID=A0A3N0XHU9_ANAGA|nr:Synaptic vesicle 2-related protein [Anabarilius grahami]